MSGSGPVGGPGAPDATGGVPDMVRRLRLALPLRWFPDEAPVLDALLTGWGSAWAQWHAMLQRVRRQSRLGTATGTMLDAVSQDLFGGRVPRQGEGDEAFRTRITDAIARPRVTRAAVAGAAGAAGADDVQLFEPMRPADTGAWGGSGSGASGAMGYGVSGGWGSLAMPAQVLLRCRADDAEAVRLAVLDALPAGVAAWMHVD